MINYLELSQQVINEKVAKLVLDYEDIWLVPNQDFIKYSNGANWIRFDPCNWANDAWKIILNHKLSLEPIGDTWIVTSLCGNYQTNDNNPLQAAMIVFLMMNEDKLNG